MPQFEQAGFLTYSRIKNLPDLVMDLRQWYESLIRFLEITAAGLSGISTRFPFHPECRSADRTPVTGQR